MKQPVKKRESNVESIGRGGGSSVVLFQIAIKTLKSMRMKPQLTQSDSDSLIRKQVMSHSLHGFEMHHPGEPSSDKH
jgi:hypothetical protein